MKISEALEKGVKSGKAGRQIRGTYFSTFISPEAGFEGTCAIGTAVIGAGYLPAPGDLGPKILAAFDREVYVNHLRFRDATPTALRAALVETARRCNVGEEFDPLVADAVVFMNDTLMMSRKDIIKLLKKHEL